MAYTITMPDQHGRTLATFTETHDAATGERRLELTYRAPELPGHLVAQLRADAEKQWRGEA
jgi:hypothetical protein